MRWRLLLFLSVCAVGLIAGNVLASVDAGPTITFRPALDSIRLLHNPACGWVIYANSSKELDEYATVIPYATLVHIRVPWSRMEPAEGQYAWNNDPSFISFVKEIKRRGLRISLA